MPSIPLVCTPLRSERAALRRATSARVVRTVNIVLAAEFETDCILTLDRRDFRAIRPLTHHPAFRLLPDDL